MPGEKSLKQKKQVVDELIEKLRLTKSIVLADYRGLTVEQDTQLRNALRKAGVEYRVIKNTLFIRAAKECGFENPEHGLEGPTAAAFSDDYVMPAKVLLEYSTKFEKYSIKGGIVDGKAVDANGVKYLAELPPKEVLISRVLSGFNAPITGLVNVLNANIRGLVVALNAIAQKQSA